MGKVLDRLLGAALGALVDAFNAWRRDRKLEELGYTRAQRDGLATSREAVRRAIAARNAVDHDPDGVRGDERNRDAD